MDTEIYSYESDRIRPIHQIRFGIYGNEEIKKGSAFKDTEGVVIPDLYDNGEPKKGGLIDTRMGTTDQHIDCGTCGLSSLYCVGHFGHINLAEPVFNMAYIPHVKRILDCICLKCSKLLVHKNEDEITEMLKTKSGKGRMAEIRSLVKNVAYCQKAHYGCGTPVAKIKLEIKKQTATISMIAETTITGVQSEEAGGVMEKKVRQVLTPEIVYDILKNVSDTDCLIMGLDPKTSRPELMIHKIFPVPPVQIRPSTRADFMSAQNLEDDLTHKLADIIKSNHRIIKHRETTNDESGKFRQDHLHLLQYHVASYFDNDTSMIPASKQKDRPIKSLSSRLKGKEGRVRGNLMGNEGCWVSL